MFLLFLSHFFSFNLNDYLAQPAKYLNSSCNQTILTSSQFNGLFQSFLCGKKLDKSLPKETLIKAGIYHLIVVSGGHFLFLESIFKILKLPFYLRTFLLILYYLTTNLQAPGLRALIHLLASKLKDHWGIKTSALTLLLYTGIVCLILNSSYWQSLSFWLSFNVSLAITACSELLYWEKPIPKFFWLNFLIYLFLLPFLLRLSYSHPLSVFMGNILVMPTIIFFSICGLGLVTCQFFNLPRLVAIIDDFIRFYFQLLESLSCFSFNKNQTSWDWLFFWAYLLVLFIILHFLKIYFERRHLYA